MEIILVIFSILLVILLVVQIYTLNKIKRIDVNTWERFDPVRSALDNLFRQYESLQAIYTDLRLEHSLPQTRSWAGSPDLLAALVREVQSVEPQVVVECSSGVSTVVLARALQLRGRGHVYSLEHEDFYAQKTRQELMRHGLAEWATVIHAPLLPCGTALGEKLWYDVSNLPVDAIDMMVIDGPPESTGPLARYPAGPILFGRLAPTASVFLDDAARNDEKQAVKHWLTEFTQMTLTELPCEKGLAVLRQSRPV